MGYYCRGGMRRPEDRMTAEQQEKPRDKVAEKLWEIINRVCGFLLVVIALGALWLAVSVIRLMWNHSLF